MTQAQQPTTLTYEAWRITYQSSDQAARAAYESALTLGAELAALKAEPAAQAVEPGIELVAKFLQKRAGAYADEHLSTDPGTGAAEGGEHQIEYWNWLLELVDEVLALLSTPPAQAVEPTQRVTVDFKQANELLDMFGGEPSSVTLGYGNGHSGNGLYAIYTDMPEEGSHFLGETDSDAAPQAQPVVLPEWEKVRRGLTMVMLGFAGSPDCSVSAAEAALDAVTEPGMPLAGLRALLATGGQAQAATCVATSQAQDVQRDDGPSWMKLYYAWRKVGADLKGLNWGEFTHSVHYAPEDITAAHKELDAVIAASAAKGGE